MEKAEPMVYIFHAMPSKWNHNKATVSELKGGEEKQSRRKEAMRNPMGSSTEKNTGKVTPCCSKIGLKRGPWTPEEDELLSASIKNEGEGRWRTLPKRAGLLRCGKSCRLRWMNYLRPCVKRGQITLAEEDLILRLHRLLGNRWSLIAGRIPGRTDNEIKNYWNTHLSKKLISQGIDPRTHKQLNPSSSSVVGKGSGCLVSSSDLVPVKFQKAGTDGGCLVDGAAQVSSDLKYGCFNGAQFQGLDGSYREEDVSIYGDDDVFTLFLNSLINEDMPECSSHGQRQMMEPVFMVSDDMNQQKQQISDADVVYQQNFGHETNWESLISTDYNQADPMIGVDGCVKDMQPSNGDC